MRDRRTDGRTGGRMNGRMSSFIELHFWRRRRAFGARTQHKIWHKTNFMNKLRKKAYLIICQNSFKSGIDFCNGLNHSGLNIRSSPICNLLIVQTTQVLMLARVLPHDTAYWYVFLGNLLDFEIWMDLYVCMCTCEVVYLYNNIQRVFGRRTDVDGRAREASPRDTMAHIRNMLRTARNHYIVDNPTLFQGWCRYSTC